MPKQAALAAMRIATSVNHHDIVMTSKEYAHGDIVRYVLGRHANMSQRLWKYVMDIANLASRTKGPTKPHQVTQLFSTQTRDQDPSHG